MRSLERDDFSSNRHHHALVVIAGLDPAIQLLRKDAHES
jgi:hypothetical protein